jgi:hypothetical protein
MGHAPTDWFLVQRNVILGLLLTLAAACSPGRVRART